MSLYSVPICAQKLLLSLQDPAAGDLVWVGSGKGIFTGIFKTALPRQFPAFCHMEFALLTVSSLLWQRFFFPSLFGFSFHFLFPFVSEGL